MIRTMFRQSVSRDCLSCFYSVSLQSTFISAAQAPPAEPSLPIIDEQVNSFDNESDDSHQLVVDESAQDEAMNESVQEDALTVEPNPQVNDVNHPSVQSVVEDQNAVSLTGNSTKPLILYQWIKHIVFQALRAMLRPYHTLVMLHPSVHSLVWSPMMHRFSPHPRLPPRFRWWNLPRRPSPYRNRFPSHRQKVSVHYLCSSGLFSLVFILFN